MEFEVRVVAGIDSCFVSLPLALIQTLDSTHSGNLPPCLALQLRSLHDQHLWHVAWSGSASASPAIEIAQQYADCICLPDSITVQVRVVPNLPKATMVTIEPHSEDDWEVLELNAELAEASILEQVGIVHESMRFPLWLHGKAVITFLVVSTLPSKPIVQLVPGTEVAVAPKRRKRNINSNKDTSVQSPVKDSKALLRTQDLDRTYTHRFEINGAKISVVLTTAVFVNPKTAKHYSFEPLQFVALEPRFASKESKNNNEKNGVKERSKSTAKGVNAGTIDENRQIVVRILVSDLVAEGHVMLSRSLRLYLRAGLHSWLYLKRCNIDIKEDPPLYSLSPCSFRMKGNSEELENNGTENLLDTHKPKTTFLHSILDDDVAVRDWSTHDRVVSSLFYKSASNEDKEAYLKSFNKNRIPTLLYTWCLSQFQAIVSNAGQKVSSLVLPNKTLFHFEVKSNKFEKDGKRNKSGESYVDIIYILSNIDESLYAEEIYGYEIFFDIENGDADKPKKLDLMLGKLKLGDSISFNSIKEKSSNKRFNTNVSALKWMGTAVSDVTNSRVENPSFSCFRNVL
jgi:peroxin-1